MHKFININKKVNVDINKINKIKYVNNLSITLIEYLIFKPIWISSEFFKNIIPWGCVSHLILFNKAKQII